MTVADKAIKILGQIKEERWAESVKPGRKVFFRRCHRCGHGLRRIKVYKLESRRDFDEIACFTCGEHYTDYPAPPY